MNKHIIILILLALFCGHSVMAAILNLGPGGANPARLIKGLKRSVEYPINLYEIQIGGANKLFVTRVISRLVRDTVPGSDIAAARNEICSTAKIFDKGTLVDEAYRTTAGNINLPAAATIVAVVLNTLTDPEKAKVAAAWVAAAGVVDAVTNPAPTGATVAAAANGANVSIAGQLPAAIPTAAAGVLAAINATLPGANANAAATAGATDAIVTRNADKVFLAAATLASAAAQRAILSVAAGQTLAATATAAKNAAAAAKPLVDGVVAGMGVYTAQAIIVLNKEIDRLVAAAGASQTIPQGMPKAVAMMIAEGKHGMGYSLDEAKMMLSGAALVGGAAIPVGANLANIKIEVGRIAAVNPQGRAAELAPYLSLNRTPGAMGFYKFQDTIIAIHPKELMGEPLSVVLRKLKNADADVKKRIASYYFHEMIRVLKDTQGADIIWNNDSLSNFYVQLDGHLTGLDFSAGKKDPTPNNLDSAAKIKEREVFLTQLVLPMFNILFPEVGEGNAAATSAHNIFIEVINPAPGPGGLPNWQDNAANYSYAGFFNLGLVPQFQSLSSANPPYKPGIDRVLDGIEGIARADHDGGAANNKDAQGYLGRDGFAIQVEALRTLYDLAENIAAGNFGRLDYPPVPPHPPADNSLCNGWTGL